MDADILRLILFLAGVALILGIYFWDRSKKVNQRVHAIRKAQQQAQDETQQPSPAQRQEPVWSGAQTVADEDAGSDLEQALGDLGQMVQEEAAHKPADPLAEQVEFAFSMDDDDQPVGAATTELPQMILQLNLRARKQPFQGEAIMRATRDLAMELGEMQIFHHYDDQQHKVIFSMASMVEPGTFDEQQMAGFSTPGVTLFAQLPGPREGLETFSLMLSAAERLAALLDGELQDGSHSDLSRQTIEHIREEITEHSRQVRLARSRR